MKRITAIFASVLILFVFQKSVNSQTYPVIGTSGSHSASDGAVPGGVFSKNMELICPLPVRWNSDESFEFIPITHGSTTDHYIVTTDRTDDDDGQTRQGSV
jgi:hypothetical protein